MKINDSYFIREERVETRKYKTIHRNEGKTFQQLPAIFYASKKVLETLFVLLHVCDKMMLLQNNLLKGENLFPWFFFVRLAPSRVEFLACEH